jgi:acyl-coenzyme A synthetase/AMP-(fatty) acid ligase
VALSDHLELHDSTRFRLLGRFEDMVNIAGKRASLVMLNQRLLEIPGVEDGAFIVPPDDSASSTRLAALVVAPALSKRALLQALAQRIDAAFLPRPLYQVERLPRNATGKLPQRDLLALLKRLQRRS